MDIGRYLDNIDKKFTRKETTKMKQYDYLIVGSGLYGAVFAQQAMAKGKKVLVIDKRPNIAGNVYTEDIEKIHVHKYGAHIFHTNNKKVWNYITKFAEFNRFTNSPVANYKGELYSLPFNMYTFNKMWGVITPEEAQAKIEEQKKEAGIIEDEKTELALTHDEMEQMTDDELKEVLPKLRVVSRAKPLDKKRLVTLAQEREDVCGMTGDR